MDTSDLVGETHGDEESLRRCISAQNAYIAMDSPKGAIRHANFVESRYCCVFVTPDNVSTLVQSTSQNRVQHLTRLIIGHMSHSILISQQTLDTMEQLWTGTSRLTIAARQPAEPDFYTVFTCTSYLTPEWHQVRELFVIAIKQDAWAAVAAAAKIEKRSWKAMSPNLFDAYGIDNVSEIVERLRAGSPQQVLLYISQSKGSESCRGLRQPSVARRRSGRRHFSWHCSFHLQLV